MNEELLVEGVRLIHGDCLDALKTLEANSIDSIVTDPPYGLSFMNKHWDYNIPSMEIWRECLRVIKPGGHLLSFSGTRTYHRMVVNIEDAGFEIRDQIGWLYGTGFPKSHTMAPGWGSALKPAWEPIVVARKQVEGTLEQNWQKWGVGGLNIDGCRVGDEVTITRRNGDSGKQTFGRDTRVGEWENPPGRFPANIIHDGSDEVVAAFPSENKGSAARFFWSPKASRKDRNDGLEGFAEKALNWSSGTKNPGSFQSEGTHKAAQNYHPTVKPTELMRYLCRLVTPPNGLVLDPFMGSGSTGKAAMFEDFKFIGIEREVEYIEIAQARINHAAGLLRKR